MLQRLPVMAAEHTTATTAAPPPAPYQLGDTPFTVQGLILILGLIVSVLTIIKFFQAQFGKYTEMMEKRVSGLEGDVTEIKIKLQDFVPKGEIDRGYDHLRNTMKHMDEAFGRAIERQSDKVNKVDTGLARVQERVESAHDSMTEIKTMVRDMGAKMERGFERLGNGVH